MKIHVKNRKILPRKLSVKTHLNKQTTHSKDPPTILFRREALTHEMSGRMLYAFDEKMTKKLANVKSDLRHDGGSDPVGGTVAHTQIT